MITYCLEGLYTVCLILTPLQLIRIQLFAYVCIFHLQFLVRCWCGQLSSLSKEMFSLKTLSTQSVQHVSIVLKVSIYGHGQVRLLMFVGKESKN